MTLNPYLTKDMLGVWYLNWTADPAASAYEVIAPDGTHIQIGKKQTKVKLGRNPQQGAWQVASAIPATYEPAVYPPFPVVGTPVYLHAGTWQNNPTSYAFVLARYQSGAKEEVVLQQITPASVVPYTPVDADRGRTLRLDVTATNTGGSATATSASTAVVT